MRLAGTQLVTVGASRTVQASSTRRHAFRARRKAPYSLMLVPVIQHFTIAGNLTKNANYNFNICKDSIKFKWQNKKSSSYAGTRMRKLKNRGYYFLSSFKCPGGYTFADTINLTPYKIAPAFLYPYLVTLQRYI